MPRADPLGPQSGESLSRLLALYAHGVLVCGAAEERPRTHAPGLGKHLANPLRLQVLDRMSALPPQIESLFVRHPALCGFSVRGLDDVPDSCPRPADGGSGLFVGDIGVSPELSREQFGEIFEEIVTAVAEVLAEAPQGGETLRGRTFARALH